MISHQTIGERISTMQASLNYQLTTQDIKRKIKQLVSKTKRKKYTIPERKK